MSNEHGQAGSEAVERAIEIAAWIQETMTSNGWTFEQCALLYNHAYNSLQVEHQLADHRASLAVQDVQKMMGEFVKSMQHHFGTSEEEHIESHKRGEQGFLSKEEQEETLDSPGPGQIREHD